MKCSLGISNFLEEISSLSHSVVFLYFFALTTEEGFLISLCYSLELCIQMGIFFLFSFAFHFESLHSGKCNFQLIQRCYPEKEYGQVNLRNTMLNRDFLV